MLTGRKREINILNRMFKSNSSELIAVFGRRRAGKTFLVGKVYKKHMVFQKMQIALSCLQIT